MTSSIDTKLPVVIRSDPWRLMRLFLFASFFILVGLLLILNDPIPRKQDFISVALHRTVGIVSILFGMVTQILIIRARNRILVIISEKGLEWPSGEWILWENLISSKEYTTFGNRVLYLKLREKTTAFSNNRSDIHLGFAAASLRDFQLAETLIKKKIFLTHKDLR